MAVRIASTGMAEAMQRRAAMEQAAEANRMRGLEGGMASIADAFRRRQAREDMLKQREELKRRYEDEVAHRAEREGVLDERFTEGRDYSRGRDVEMDTRFYEGRNYRRGRDAKSDDERQQAEMRSLMQDWLNSQQRNDEFDRQMGFREKQLKQRETESAADRELRKELASMQATDPAIAEGRRIRNEIAELKLERLRATDPQFNKAFEQVAKSPWFADMSADEKYQAVNEAYLVLKGQGRPPVVGDNEEEFDIDAELDKELEGG